MGSLKILNLQKPSAGFELENSLGKENVFADFSVEKSKEKNIKGLTKLILSMGYFVALVFSLVKLLS